jgi:hypothetical protein
MRRGKHKTERIDKGTRSQMNNLMPRIVSTILAIVFSMWKGAWGCLYLTFTSEVQI